MLDQRCDHVHLVDSQLAFMVDGVVSIDGVLVAVKGDVCLGFILFHVLDCAVSTEDALDGVLGDAKRQVVDEEQVEFGSLAGQLYWSLLRLHFWR